MSNHAYANVWTRSFSAETLLPQLEALLDTVPFSATQPGFLSLVVRAVSPAETALVEQDLRRAPLSAAEIIEWGREYSSADCAFEVSACTDLWAWEEDKARWSQLPQRVEVMCNGPEYDDAVCAESGHFQIDLGFEHLFTGHAGMLGFGARPAAAPEHPAEAAFLEAMANARNRNEYQERTRQNIRRLLDWMHEIGAALPVERTLLWSEGEENFEARLDEIVAAR